MSARHRAPAGRSIGGRIAASRPLRLLVAVAAVGGVVGTTSIPAHAGGVPFGTVLVAGSQWAGADAGLGDLNVYSNGLRNQDQAGTFGAQFECTELVQRWAHFKFGEPNTWPASSAADMWNVGPSLPVPMRQNPNGGASPPQFGDIIVYGATSGDPTGHVGVVSAVSATSVTSVMQNFTVNGTPTGQWTQSMSGTSVSSLGGAPVLGWLRAGATTTARPVVVTASAPSTAVTPDGSTQTLFWKGADSHLNESWYAANAWHGPVDYASFGTLQSPPTVATTRAGQQLVFWQGTNNHLYEAWYAGSWNGPVDLTAAWGGAGLLSSAPSATTTATTQFVFWRGADGHLWEAWFTDSRWFGPVPFAAATSLASAPAATALTDGSQQLVFWQGTDNHLYETWYAGNRWNGPVPFGGVGSVQSAPSVTVTPDDSQQLVFWRGAGGHLFESWFAGSWNGPVDVTAGALGNSSPLQSSPSSAVTTDGGTQIVFWEGPGNLVYEAWWGASRWNGPVTLPA